MTAPAYGAGSISFFASQGSDDAKSPQKGVGPAIEDKASAAGSKGFTGVVIVLAVAQPDMMIEDRRTLTQGPKPAVPDVSWEPPSAPSGSASSASGGPACPMVPKAEPMVHRIPESERQGPTYGLDRILRQRASHSALQHPR